MVDLVALDFINNKQAKPKGRFPNHVNTQLSLKIASKREINLSNQSSSFWLVKWGAGPSRIMNYLLTKPPRRRRRGLTGVRAGVPPRR